MVLSQQCQITGQQLPMEQIRLVKLPPSNLKIALTMLQTLSKLIRILKSREIQ